MNIPVDVLASFKSDGQLKPIYVRLEKETGELQTVEIDKVEFHKDEKFAGMKRITFLCMIQGKMVKLYYYIDTHSWIMCKDK